MKAKKTAVLLVNLGTPDAPTVSAVRSYLAEFLSDPLVIDVPWLLRMLIVYGFILPFRPRQSAAAYQAIWTSQGSPLLVNSRDFAEQLQSVLGEEFKVVLGMRYGKPSIQQVVASLTTEDCDSIVVLPLFPQYSDAATGSALKKVAQVLAKTPYRYKTIRCFYQDLGYQEAMATQIQSYWNKAEAQFLLFSYHGLPERQLAKAGCQLTHCDRIRSCLQQQANLKNCYRAQCFATTAAIAKRMSLKEEQYQTAFQSRLGRASWIKPYTDGILEELRKRHITRLLVVCPSFVADCLETLEEIALRLEEQWLAMGGECLQLVPCLNARPSWVNAAANLLRHRLNESKEND